MELRNPNCKLCPLHTTTTGHVCVGGDGPLDADVLIIGEAPGEAEARTGKPFMGKSGQLLRGELAKNGLKNVRITNIVRCRPPNNRTPTPAEIKACRVYLDAEIEEVKPKAILTLGAPASKSVLKVSGITTAHGSITEKEGLTTCAIYHPAYALRDPSKLPDFENDIARFARHLRGEERKATVDWEIVQRVNFDSFLKDLDRCVEFAFDTETADLNWFNSETRFLRSVQLGLGFEDGSDFGWVIPMSMPGSPFNHRSLQRRVMAIVFKKLKGKYAIAHNGKFDNLWLGELAGGTFYLNFDTMLASHTLNENREHKLKVLVRGELDEPDYDIDTEEKQGRVVKDLMKFYRYGAYDSVYTLRMKRRVFMPAFRKDPVMRRLFFGLVMPAARAFEQIDRNGLFVNLDLMRQTEKEVQRNLEDILCQLNELVKKHCGPNRSINWNSPPQISKLMYGDLKLKCTVFTPKGAPSTGEEALLELKDQHPIADMLVRYRELEKFRSTYLEGWKTFMVDSMLYLSTKLHGTVTGRYSNRLHQVPRDGTIRNLIDAPPGWIFVQADFSQAELRIAAILAKDVELISCYRQGIDVHWRTLMTVIGAGAGGEYEGQAFKTASTLNGRKRPRSLTEALEILMAAGHERCIEIWKGWKEARKRAKAINFGFLYGMRELKFIETCKLKYGFEPSMRDAEKMRRVFFSLYRQLPEWHKKQTRLCKLNGYVYSLSGRMRRLPGIYSTDWKVSSEAERQAINSPVQGYIGDHKAMACVEIHDTFDRNSELRIVGEVHDSILLWVRPNKLNDLLPRVADIMRTPRFVRECKINLPVPIEAEFEVGPWGAGRTWRPS